ncbi:Cyclin-D-binding Myb-like transcription factor 1 isoform 1 [Theobroma cacao]|uniref:Cyclin-D-binding Myb-like transcription factor 1 isoform 1 n=1 Tax=Theobroma cacao TaxID=3641 RepID=A0A061H0A4_THECC|nr:Cyclin-D-binding Myb-like transcription factor 1 isoform 1 [Theobroma cacao]EOY34438.1 Cyclin-D-binding Myb-like transcription factor 1 isoform 1 [Theobroma cacao]EOY34439.1 Cyclin-D-binding Myb-like transcription factor 1 isoform 1 [Theobroma cacao]
MGKKMHEKDGHKRVNNQVEEGNAVEKESDFLDVSAGNMNDVSKLINRDHDKNKRKQDNCEKKKDRMKKRKSEFDTDKKESQKAPKKHKKSKDGVGEVKEASMEICRAGKENIKNESSKAMYLGNNFELEAKRAWKDKHKNKIRDGIDAVTTATETLEHGKMQETVEVLKSCSTEDINKMVHGKEREYEKRKKKKHNLEKVTGNVDGHIAVMSSITDGNETDKKKDREDGNVIKKVEDSRNGKKRKKKSINYGLDVDKPRKTSTGIENHEFLYSNVELNGNAVECRKLGIAVDNDEDGNRDKKKKKKKKSKSLKTGSDGKEHQSFKGYKDREVDSNDKEDPADNEVECTELGGGVDNTEDGNRGRKKKSKSVKSDSEGKHHKGDARTRKSVNTTNQSEDAAPKDISKKVSFSDHVEVFPCADGIVDENMDGKEGLVYGKRYSKEEDAIVMDAVANYIESNNLGEEGLDMVLNCRAYPQVRNCWKEIQAAIPWRPCDSVYRRAHVLFERDEKRPWTPEEYELIQKFVEKHGPRWKLLADTLGKHRHHVKDTWRRIKLTNAKRGNWSQEEYQNLFDLVNLDLSMKAFEEKKSKHGMLRDNICWSAISDKMETRGFALCCKKWYYSLASPMVAEGIWADADDYRMLDALSSLDACCMEDVDWDNLIEHRSGDLCRKRWNQMVQHIGPHGVKSFAEQVEVLANRYRPDMLDAREAYDSKCPVDLP